ncbi:hypothetical protein P152DRAFT_400506 [Eremomyces bilateralis CBS 781.70]|uniref:Actin-like ATPase domain-containing protein n=1 Tax=Eremomyces bilateralis CBS 781.70 TaxID=1392243 RepID=A0A6G1FYW5_9PEZI|nr:uncharacterized protein P152DRAFT_400506 [Eremomyces bilateralis CBS 781.70]KAF1810891.1 hypothetical protein P152DRAFT_400506 [Eremomyces bilateralis CBS 781.70]
MNSNTPRPDVVVAVDFGMTCTGVAYANLSIGSKTVRWIQRWPGRSQANENKVPTLLVYPRDRPQPSSWGFLSENISEMTAQDKDYKEWFKVWLDEEKLWKAQAKAPEFAAKSIEEVEKWYTDYLRCLNQHIEAKLSSEVARKRWEDAIVEFHFSVPTTWQPATVERFRSITSLAGFGKYPSHTTTIGLTEAEAAAVHTSQEASGIFSEGDVVLVCDVGGGTTDLSVLRVTDVTSGCLSLRQLDVVFGSTVGSTFIDAQFEKEAEARLKMANQTGPLNIDIEETAWEMMKSKEFQNAKCDYGSADDAEVFSIPIPKLSYAYSNGLVGIFNGEMQFKIVELQALFDPQQIKKLFQLIDTQIQRMQQKDPSERIAHMVLSGGLGNSLYVQRKLRERYAAGDGSPHLNTARQMQVRVAPDPQLAVCKGLVADRIAKLSSGKSILGWRCCRASYGTKCKVLYNPENPQHHNRQTVRDALDDKLYLHDTVEWFIKKGDPVSIDRPIIHNFRRKVPPGDPTRIFPTDVIASNVAKEILPFQIDPSIFKLKNRHFWNNGPKYYRVEFSIRVVLGPGTKTLAILTGNTDKVFYSGHSV